jgi:hypothetical protein
VVGLGLDTQVSRFRFPSWTVIFFFVNTLKKVFALYPVEPAFLYLENEHDLLPHAIPKSESRGLERALYGTDEGGICPCEALSATEFD